MPWLLYPPGKDLVPIVQEAAWAPRIGPEGYGKLTATGIRLPPYSE